VPQDRVRLRQACAVVELEHRHAPGRVLAQKLGCAGLAVEDRHLDAFVLLTDQCEQQLDLVAIAGTDIRVEAHARNIAANRARRWPDPDHTAS
jgi:hypothetical protein